MIKQSTAAAAGRRLTFALPAGSDVHFLYLGENGTWFDDPDADRIGADGGYVSL